ncbi:DUF6279 family lipoprotein [Limnohabitans sp. B9-3]|uniref:DUF6279 family lipoprotein n=1 Tax=Limnohabitans sp. B9-3 TaxID=1100707 RepID=UPI000CBFDCCB|nr:DUF6279 family lipoprotein [Limnohabitans sp. B9-3]PIT72336.1 hypothetical protein B9Z42_12345 [Limnohabitans sp. B9-3]
MLFILLLRRIIRQASLWLTLVALVALTGCSTIKVAYNNSDDLLYWWVNSYADLQDGQKQLTRDTLTELQRWHRQEQLPEYVALLQKVRAMAASDITPAQVCAVTEEGKTSFATLLRFVEPASTRLVVQFKPEQLRSVRKKFEKTAKDWRKDWLDIGADERLQYRNKQALNRLEDFYGRLDTPQREVLRHWLSESVFDPAMSYAERERRQADTMQTLQRMTQEGSASAQAQALWHGLIERSFNSPNERFRAYNRALWQENCEGFAKLHNSTTPAQRKRLAESLQGYENDFRTLMGQK